MEDTVETIYKRYCLDFVICMPILYSKLNVYGDFFNKHMAEPRIIEKTKYVYTDAEFEARRERIEKLVLP